MAIPTPQEAAKRLGDGIRNGGSKYTSGVNAVQTNPASQAIAKRNKWVAAMQNPETHNKWEAGLSRVTLADWKNAAGTVGAQRYSQSADKAQSNYQDFAADFFPFLNNVQQQINNMPDVTLEERIQKAVANMRAIAQYQRS